LEHWSRKKIEGERDLSGAPAAVSKSPAGEPGLPERSTESDIKAPAEAQPRSEFDLASLPSLESITTVTDIRAFLAPGVPKELARAALRRAWSADPAIRDFVGLAENAWDFNDPTAMPGFSSLPSGYDKKKVLAQIFGDDERPAPAEARAQQPGDTREVSVAEENALLPAATESASPALSNEKSDAPTIPAEHQQATLADDEIEKPKRRRRHGGALPQ
jgi:hypothetical protein